MPRTGQARLDGLSGLRFLAALHVVLFHYGAPMLAAAPGWLRQVRASGYVAVSFFFLLSGFILAYHYGAAAADGTLDRRTFWVNRFSRIYPVYALALLLLVPLALVPAWGTACFGAASPFSKGVTGLAHVTLLQAWVPQLVGSWNLPGWSISVEAFFYALFPFAAVWLAKLRSPRQLLFAMLSLWVLSLLPGLAYVHFDPDRLSDVASGADGFWLRLLKHAPAVRLPEFLFGACLGRLFLVTGAGASGRRLWSVAAPASLVGLGLALAASGGIPFPLFHNGLLDPLFAVLIFATAASRGAFSRLLGSRPLVSLGEASYALYILQMPLMFLAGAALGPAFFRTALGSLAFVGGTVGASLLCYRWLERPVQDRIREAFRRGAPGRPAPVPTSSALGT